MNAFWKVRRWKFLLLIGILSGCVLQTNDTVPTITPTPLRIVTDTPTPFVMPTPPPPPTASCAGAPRERLVIGERGRVLPDDPRPVNVRRLPGTENKMVTTIPINGVFQVMNGPVCADGFQWYQVHYREATGWLAEGDLTSYYVEPYGVD